MTSGHPAAPVVRRATDRDISQCVEIVTGLPDYFTDDVPDKLRADMGNHTSWVLADDDAVIGFAVVERRGRHAAEILWAAVASRRRNARLGTRLVKHLLGELRADNVCVVEVKTLDPSAEYPPYTATYAFWTARGFVQLDSIDPLPGWPPGNPAAILAAALVPTC